MMGVLQLSGAALLSAFLVLVLRELRAPLALPLRVLAVLLLFGTALALCAPVLRRIEMLFSFAGAADYASVLLRAAGIAVLSELTASLCRELGEGGIAGGVLFFGKLEILVLCLPLVDEILSLAKEMLAF